MALRDVRRLLIDCLRSGHYQHESREALAEKNLLAIGEVTAEFVIDLIKACADSDYELRPHDLVPQIKVHIMTPTLDGERWYVKVYMISPEATFISVHLSKPPRARARTEGR